ncbi:ribokinase [Pelagibacterium mangrovi]|uniref:ribokinase n=1 Tax=Pelagibacterium mangrovi TaxID=3119828 RepID=UPI002FC5E59D
MTGTILVIGSLNQDVFLRLGRAPLPGETMLVLDSFVAAGGKGANQAMAAARAGGVMTMVGAIGDDAPGRALLDSLRSAGIGCADIAVLPDVATGQATVMSYPDGENTILVSSGANARVDIGHLSGVPAALQRAGLLLVQGELPADTTEHAIALAKDAGVPVLLDPAPAGVVRLSWLRDVAFVTPNRVELSELTGMPTADLAAVERAAMALRDKGVGHVLAKLGRDGVLVVGPEGARRIPTIAVEPLDTTGAGDMFAGAFATIFLERGDVPNAVAFGAVAASLSTLKEGASGSFPERSQIIEALTGLGSGHWTGE